jgi:hypothetical protein
LLGTFSDEPGQRPQVFSAAGKVLYLSEKIDTYSENITPPCELKKRLSLRTGASDHRARICRHQIFLHLLGIKVFRRPKKFGNFIPTVDIAPACELMKRSVLKPGCFRPPSVVS